MVALSAAELKKREAIDSCEFLKDLGDKSKAKLCEFLYETTLRKNVAVFGKGDISNSMYFVTYGEIEISIESPNQKRILLNILRPGSSFGEIGLIDRGQRTADAKARSLTKLLVLDRRNFVKLANDFSFDEWILLNQKICKLLRRINYNLEILSLENAESRLMLKLYELAYNADEMKNPVNLKVSQLELAEMVNLSRETINKTLAKIESLGLIDRDYGEISILDPSKLNAYISGMENL